MKVAILDDYLKVADQLADWSSVSDRCELTFFSEAIDPERAAEVLAPFDVLCLMRERTPFPAALFEALPNLKLLISTGWPNRAVDLDAATRAGVLVSYAEGNAKGPFATPELAFGLMLSIARHIPHETANIAAGGWQSRLGTVLAGKTLGLVGLGRIGQLMARYATAFGMNVVAWSQNLTDATAESFGVVRLEKEELFRTADFISIHYVLSDRSRHLVGRREFGWMKPSAALINTSRGLIVDQAALVEALRERRIAAAGLDVFEREPLPVDDPLRKLDNVVLTPHSGYVVDSLMTEFYRQTCGSLAAFLDGKPVRVVNPEILERTAPE